ncbi:hypothetical protein JCM11641_004219 [Rhodosporidiobolus odoratus]
MSAPTLTHETYARRVALAVDEREASLQEKISQIPPSAGYELQRKELTKEIGRYECKIERDGVYPSRRDHEVLATYRAKLDVLMQDEKAVHLFQWLDEKADLSQLDGNLEKFEAQLHHLDDRDKQHAIKRTGIKEQLQNLYIEIDAERRLYERGGSAEGFSDNSGGFPVQMRSNNSFGLLQRQGTNNSWRSTHSSERQFDMDS